MYYPFLSCFLVCSMKSISLVSTLSIATFTMQQKLAWSFLCTIHLYVILSQENCLPPSLFLSALSQWIFKALKEVNTLWKKAKCCCFLNSAIDQVDWTPVGLFSLLKLAAMKGDLKIHQTLGSEKNSCMEEIYVEYRSSLCLCIFKKFFSMNISWTFIRVEIKWHTFFFNKVWGWAVESQAPLY